MLELRVATADPWVTVVLDDFDDFLLDHAACERKASANAISLVTHYPDRRELVRLMIELAREELHHFQQVHRLVEDRGLMLARDRKDPYLNALLKRARRGRDDYFLDRLLIGGIAEARGCERFGLIARALEKSGADSELAAFYANLSESEARHCDLFVDLAELYFDKDRVGGRLSEWLDDEARIVSELPLAAALH
jgi:tRNA-(ms[2]io[6]A)-hydroxylase